MTRYCLQWDNHTTNLVLNLAKLYETQEHLDVTLRCQDNDIGVHKCVLMAGSLYFQEQLRQNATTTIIMVKTVQFKILKLLIEFIYKGEIFVEESDVTSVLAAAKFFKITGLSGIDSRELDPTFDNISNQLNCFEDPKFLHHKEVEEVLNELHIYSPETAEKSIPADIIDHSDFQSSILSKESNDKEYDENSTDKFPSFNSEIMTSAEEFIGLPVESISEQYSETIADTYNEEYCEDGTVTEEYSEIVSDNKTENFEEVNENAVETTTICDINPVIDDPKVISNELETEDEHFEDEEYLEEHLESLNENSLPENVDCKSNDIATNKALQVLQEAGVPTDVPIYCEGNDGSFVELTKDVLEEIASGGQVIYQVVDEEGKPSELLLGTAVKQSRAPTPQEQEISSNVVYDKFVSEALYMTSPTPSLQSLEKTILNSEVCFENTVDLEDAESKIFESNVKVEEPSEAKFTRERKMNSRYYNPNLTSPFFELNQRKAQKRSIPSSSKNGNVDEYSTAVKTEIEENADCDLIEQKIAELHADFSSDLTNYVNGVEHVELEDISKVLNDNEHNGISIVKLASKRRKMYESNNRKKCKSLFKFDSPKIISENNVNAIKVTSSQRRKKTTSETSDTSVQSTSKEIPYALGLLPLRKALKKIQNMPDHTPRKTRSNVTLNKNQNDDDTSFDKRNRKKTP